MPELGDKPNIGDKKRIGLCLSGGGSRAVAFHLGCLRALNELGLLDQVKVLSTVSGGSVIGALYAARDQSFHEFEAEVRTFLKSGLIFPSLRTAATTSAGVEAISCWVVIALGALVRFSGKRLLSLVGARRLASRIDAVPTMRRWASRTTILLETIEREYFRGIRLVDLPERRPLLIVNATELQTGSAFYFSRNESGSWRLGRIDGRKLLLSFAVTASAAYPVFLPALDVEFEFTHKDGTQIRDRAVLTDGGVYDNLGLNTLWPDRDQAVSLNVDVAAVDTIICCRAGYGQGREKPGRFFGGRMTAAFETTHERSQNAAVKRLFDLKNAGKLRDIVLPYLGQNDEFLECRPDDLVTRADVENYPTDFSAMSDEWIDKLSKRGEQLTKAVIAQHSPHLVDNLRKS